MTTIPLWPSWLDDIWAKSPTAKTGVCGESLAQHTWSVLEKLAQTMRLRPGVPDQVGLPTLWSCLFWAGFLHDFGKAADGFQARLRGGPKWPHRHEVLSLAFVDWVADGFSQEELRWIAAGIASHHRDAAELKITFSGLWLGEENLLLPRIEELTDGAVTGLWRWLKECSPTWIEVLGFCDARIRSPALPSEGEALRWLRTQGADRGAYWLKAYVRLAENLQRRADQASTVGGLALRGFAVSCDHMASAHAGEIPRPDFGPREALLARLGLADGSLYAHQEQASETRGSAVLVAPTGSGKTEAALLWSCAQAGPRLYYMLPYQASMNAMYDRLADEHHGAFPHQVGLEHSRSALALYRRLLDKDYSPADAERAARWERNLAQLSHYPVRVLSPYQMLKGPFRLRGYESLLSDYLNGMVILDELHAYEVERLAMILGTVRYLCQSFGTRFFVMSATLPDLLQVRVKEALGDYAPIRASSSLFKQFQRHLLRVADGDLLEVVWLDRIGNDSNNGCSVLVCCNTVQRAQRAYDELKHRLGEAVEVLLLHGRFNGRDRLEKEQIVRAATGAQSGKRRPIVLVATQVVEVSLDIDLDVIYTDPAPLEALIQRFGRVNRRHLMTSAQVHVFTQPDDGQGVYEPGLVQASLRVLLQNRDQMIDEEGVGQWLRQVYQGDLAAQWNHRYEQAYRDFANGPLYTLRAFAADPQLEELFYQAFDSIEVLPRSCEVEYEQMWRDEPLSASQLLVPIRWGQYCALRRRGLVTIKEEGQPRVVDAIYGDELGLQL